MTTSNRPKVHTHFKTDEYLMYHIQDITKLPTVDILGFFYDLAKKVEEMGIDYMLTGKTSAMRKKIHDYFPGTSIPFSLSVEGNLNCWRGNPHSGDISVSSTILVGFPDAPTHVDQTQLVEKVTEKALLGGADLALFEKPAPKTPKMYKDLMKEVRATRLE